MSRLILVLSVVLGSFISMPLAIAQEGIELGQCPHLSTGTSVCQTYRVDSGEFLGNVDFLQVQLHHFHSAQIASIQYEKFALPGYPSDIAGEHFVGVELGDEYAYYPAANLETGETSAAYLLQPDFVVDRVWR